MFRRLFQYTLPLRGGKKGKGKGEEVKIEATTDIINIYKDRTDPELKPESEYPSWLFPMVSKYDDHPSLMVDRMYRNIPQTLNYSDKKRLWKWSKRVKIIIKNNGLHKPYETNPKNFSNFDIDIPGAEDSDMDPEDILGPLTAIAFGAPPKAIIEECLEKVRYELGFIKRDP